MVIKDPEVRKILEKYEKKLKKNIDVSDIENYEPSNFSVEYETFREEALSTRLTAYENWCSITEKIIKIRPPEKQRIKLEKNISMAHLNVTPTGAASFAAFISMVIIIISVVIGVILFLIDHDPSIFLFPLVITLFGLLLVKPLTNLPNFISARWRMKATNQMVLCILYVVMYMRHTSNLEHAIKFATDHIGNPLALDLRKVFWDIETKKFATIKESLDFYLTRWRDYSLEFVNAFHLVQGSLYEPSETRRLELLDKALEVILERTYEKMLKYARELTSPVTMLHMLGVVLPILGLVIFPLLGSFMGGSIKWYHLAILYNILLPLLVFTLGSNILSKRPTGFGEGIEIKGRASAFSLAFFVGFVLIIMGLIPVIIGTSYDFNFFGGKFFDYRGGDGPFGIGALLMGMFIPLGIGLGMSIYYGLKTKEAIKIREETKKLEDEFGGSLFQLGTRVGDGIPTEAAFSDVAETMQGTPAGDFFRMVNINIRSLGMGLREAIFNKNNGAILYFPSNLIRSSMEILIESSRKGPQIVARSLISISDYINSVHKVNERIKDLLAEVVSSMKSQINFLAPIIAGVVVGISSMLVNIIGKLGDMVSSAAAQGDTSSLGNLGAISTMFKIKDAIPGFYFQIVVGIYVVQIIYILTMLSNGVENGVDKLNEQNQLGKNLLRGVGFYIIVALIVTLIFNAMANTILTSIGQ